MTTESEAIRAEVEAKDDPERRFTLSFDEFQALDPQTLIQVLRLLAVMFNTSVADFTRVLGEDWADRDNDPVVDEARGMAASLEQAHTEVTNLWTALRTSQMLSSLGVNTAEAYNASGLEYAYGVTFGTALHPEFDTGAEVIETTVTEVDPESDLGS